MHNLDMQAKQIKRTYNPLGSLIDGYGNIVCRRCGSRNTHVVDVVWELDPLEGDRRRVRLEVRCENEGHGYFLLIRNHEGLSSVECADIAVDFSPWSEGARW